MRQIGREEREAEKKEKLPSREKYAKTKFE